jgi:hypothetical protein
LVKEAVAEREAEILMGGSDSAVSTPTEGEGWRELGC